MHFRIDDVGASTKLYEQYGLQRVVVGGRAICPMPGTNLGPLKRCKLFKGWGPYRELSASEWNEILPVFEAHNVVPLIGVTASWVDERSQLHAFPKRFPEQASILKRAFKAGIINIANHGLTHCRVGMHLPTAFTSNRKHHREFWPDIDGETHRSHILESQNILESWLESTVSDFVPPGGVWCRKTYEALQGTSIKRVHSTTYMSDYVESMEGIEFVQDTSRFFSFHDRDLQIEGTHWLESVLQQFQKVQSSHLPSPLSEEIVTYYTTYYRDTCSLPDWRKRVLERLEEEEVEKRRSKTFFQRYGLPDVNAKHCIVGTGTGGLAVVLAKEYGCKVAGVEPDTEALKLTKRKLEIAGIDSHSFYETGAEDMPFKDSEFDAVHCFTVLEHVHDVTQSVKEMVRIVKPGGMIRLHTPNYAFPYEGHYKIMFPTFAPKIIGRWYLQLRTKNPKFLDSINYLTPKSVDSILTSLPNIEWVRQYASYAETPRTLRDILLAKLRKIFGAPQQDIIIFKH